MTQTDATTVEQKPEIAALDCEASAKPSLGNRTASGFAWMLMQTLGIKVVSFFTQIVLAWLLTKQDFGLVALTYAIGNFPSLLRDAGLNSVLVHRQKKLHLWENSAFWLSMVMGIVAGLIITAIGAVNYHRGNHTLGGLMWVLAAASTISSLGTVPNAKLQTDLRFRFQAVLGFWSALLTAGLNVLFASKWFGWGAYAMMVPLVIVNVVRTVAMWIETKPSVKMHLQWRRWKYLLRDSGMVLLTSIAIATVSQGDYLTLGFFYEEAVVGVFFFAFNLSMQTWYLLTLNLTGVLFPALSKLQDNRQKQTEAFLKASRLLAILGIPLCLFQAAAADAGVHLVFGMKWAAAIPVLQIMSIACAIRVNAAPAGSFITAQGRFGLNLILVCSYAVGFIISVSTGAIIGLHHGANGGPVCVAIAEAIFFSVVDPLNVYIAVKINGGTTGDVVRVYFAPLVAGGIATALAWGASFAVPPVHGKYLIQLVVIGIVSFTAYIPLIRLFAPRDSQELGERLKRMIGRGRSSNTVALPA